MGTYRKLPVEIDAVQWTGENWSEIVDAFGTPIDVRHDPDSHSLIVSTLEGRMRCAMGDWLIRGIQAEFYPCRDDIFREKYEQV